MLFFVREILSKWLPTNRLTITLRYGCSWAVLFWAKHAPNSENDNSEDSEVDNTSCWPCEAWRSFVVCMFFSLPPISSRTEWRHLNTSWLPSTVQNGCLWIVSFETNFIRIAGISEAKTSVSEKAECSLAIGEGKKVSFLEWPSPLTKDASCEQLTAFVYVA